MSLTITIGQKIFSRLQDGSYAVGEITELAEDTVVVYFSQLRINNVPVNLRRPYLQDIKKSNIQLENV